MPSSRSRSRSVTPVRYVNDRDNVERKRSASPRVVDRKRSRSRDRPPRSRSRERNKPVRPVSCYPSVAYIQDNPEPSRVVGVFGMNRRTTQEQMESIFRKFGAIEKAVLVMDTMVRQPHFTYQARKLN
jgi:transformer-2 protein